MGIPTAGAPRPLSSVGDTDPLLTSEKSTVSPAGHPAEGTGLQAPAGLGRPSSPPHFLDSPCPKGFLAFSMSLSFSKHKRELKDSGGSYLNVETPDGMEPESGKCLLWDVRVLLGWRHSPSDSGTSASFVLKPWEWVLPWQAPKPLSSPYPIF